MATGPSRSGGEYILGHEEAELARLARQGEFYGHLTESFLRHAGVGPGMRVLDVGCGAGDVTRVAADLVGPEGSVVGIDRSPEAIAKAELRFGKAANLEFAVSDADAYRAEKPFDAVVGRCFLMYLPDPGATIKAVAASARPGGIIAFQEMVLTAARGVPDAPLFDRCADWIARTFAGAGFRPDMGLEMVPAFLAAGLPMPELMAIGRVDTGPGSPTYGYVTESVRSLLPTMEKLGIATAADAGLDTLYQRLEDESKDGSRILLLPTLIGAWSHRP